MNDPTVQRAGASARRRIAQQRATLLSAALVLVCLTYWLQWRDLGSVRHTHNTAVGQLKQMRADAGRILSLRQRPRAAAGRSRPNEELLAQIERSLAAAAIDRSKWHDSVPQPPARLPKSDYKRLTTRLYFEDITLRELAVFAHHLRAGDSTVSFSAIDLTNKRPDLPCYDVDLAVSYLVYAPQDKHSKRSSP